MSWSGANSPLKEAPSGARFLIWCGWSGSNRHSLRNRILNPARLPIPPHPQASNTASPTPGMGLRHCCPARGVRMPQDGTSRLGGSRSFIINAEPESGRATLAPEGRTARSRSLRLRHPGGEGSRDDEDREISGRATHAFVRRWGRRERGWRGSVGDENQPGDLLQPGEERCQAAARRDATAEGARGRERPAGDRRRPDARSGDVAGRHPAKDLKPGRTRVLKRETSATWALMIRSARGSSPPRRPPNAWTTLQPSRASRPTTTMRSHAHRARRTDPCIS